MRDESIINHQSNDATLSHLFMILHQLIISLSELSAGCLSILKVVGLQRNHTFKQFISFLQVLEVYGSGYADDIHPNKYKNRDR